MDTFEHIAEIYVNDLITCAEPFFEKGMMVAIYSSCEDGTRNGYLGRGVIIRSWINTFGEEICDVQKGFYIRKGVPADYLERVWYDKDSFYKSILFASVIRGGKK